jgi:RNA polymerase sigma-70 factor, ECF subfamily
MLDSLIPFSGPVYPGAPYTVAWRRLDEIPPGIQATLWLFGVARNLLMKSSHQQRSQQNLVHDLTQELARLAAYRPETADEELTEKMTACLQRLPAKQREVLLLTAWEGLKPREIAKITGSTANIVRVRLHHARQQLARELRPTTTASEDTDDPASEQLRNAPTMT